jgi:predicted phage terminase large subunit-like protein
MKLANGSTIKAESFGSSVRGGHYHLIIVDDPLKDFAGMNSEDQRNFFYGVLYPTLRPDGQLIVDGTPIAFDDLLEDIEKNTNFKTFKFPAINKEGRALWESRYSLKELEDRRKTIGSWRFSREYLLERTSSDVAPLKKEWLKWYQESPVKTGNPINIFMTIDPGLSKDETADHSGISVIGVNTDNDWYILESIKKHLNPLELINLAYELHAKWLPMVVGLETVAFQKVLSYWLLEEAKKRGIYLPIKEIKSTQRKDDRIMGLQPRIESGKLYIHPTMIDFVDEVTKFRLRNDSGSDDLLDSLAMMNEIVSVPKIIVEDPIDKLPMLEQRVWRDVRNKADNKIYDRDLGGNY